MHEEEDPRVAGAWLAIGVSALGLVTALVVAVKASTSQVIALNLGSIGFTVDTLGPSAGAVISLLALWASAAMLPQVRNERPPAAAVLFTARDARQALVLLELMLVASAFALRASADRRDSARTPVAFFLASQPGLILVAWAVLSTCGRAGLGDLSAIKPLVVMDGPANILALRMLTYGTLLLLVVPALPWVVPGLASSRPLPGAIAAFAIPAAAALWWFARFAFGGFPYAEAWGPARMGMLIPALALASTGLAAWAALARAPGAMLSLVIAAQGPLALLAFATGGPSMAGFAVGVALAVAIPLSRAAALSIAAPDRETTPTGETPALRRLHVTAIVAASAAYVGCALWLPWRFGGWWRALALLLVVAPAAVAAVRLARHCLTERPRRGPLYAWLALGGAVVALLAALPQPLNAELGSRLRGELGLNVRMRVRRGEVGPEVPRTQPPSRFPREPGETGRVR
jgi:hypothetical protein